MQILHINVVLVLNLDGDQLSVVLLQRKNSPYLGNYSLPGGKLEVGESLVNSAERELFEETSLKLDHSLKLFAILNEHLVQNEKIIAHFVINYFVGHTDFNSSTLESRLKKSDEGDLYVINADELDRLNGSIVPSDYRIVMNFLQEMEKTNSYRNNMTSPIIRYYECKIRTEMFKDREKLTVINWQSIV